MLEEGSHDAAHGLGRWEAGEEIAGDEVPAPEELTLEVDHAHAC